jgi:tyrosyl-tRNA synthetase
VYLRQISRSEVERELILSFFERENRFSNRTEKLDVRLQRTQFQLIKKKVKEDFVLSAKDLINDQFVLLQSGKKNYFVVRVV